MFKKYLMVAAALMLFALPAFAITMDNRISGNVVSFSTVTGGALTTPNIVTFNSVTRHIKLTNLSTVANCYVDLRCVDASGKRGYMTRNSATVLVPAVGRATPNTVELDFSTYNLGFCGDTNQTSSNNGVSGSNQTISYIVTGDLQDL